MTCPDCKREMEKDVGGLSSFSLNGPSLAIQFNTHVCDCGGVHKAFMDAGRDLIQYWREHPNTPPPNHKLVGPPTDEHKQASQARQKARQRMARSVLDETIQNEKQKTVSEF